MNPSHPQVSRRMSKGVRTLIGGLAGLVIAVSAQASLSTLSDRSAVGVGYTVDWSAAGAEFDDLGSGFSVPGVTVSGANGFTVMSGSTYNADFLAGDNLLAMFDVNSGNPSSGVLDFTFDSLVSSFGTQVQGNMFGAFSGVVSVYNGANALLGTVAFGGANGGNGNGSALFAGVSSSLVDIKRAVFAFGDGSAINTLSVGTGAKNDVPEPGSLMLVGLGLVVGFVGRRQARK